MASLNARMMINCLMGMFENDQTAQSSTVGPSTNSGATVPAPVALKVEEENGTSGPKLNLPIPDSSDNMVPPKAKRGRKKKSTLTTVRMLFIISDDGMLM